ncbi:MAG: hypothetical protein AAFY33_05935 [Cyanobacteria bacterium J06643_4]
MQNTSSDPPPAANQRFKPAAKLYICPANVDVSHLKGLIEVPQPIAKGIFGFLKKVKEGKGFADFCMSISPRQNNQKYQARWKAAVSHQDYFDSSAFDTMVSWFSDDALVHHANGAAPKHRHHNLVE